MDDAEPIPDGTTKPQTDDVGSYTTRTTKPYEADVMGPDTARTTKF